MYQLRPATVVLPLGQASLYSSCSINMLMGVYLHSRSHPRRGHSFRGSTGGVRRRFREPPRRTFRPAVSPTIPRPFVTARAKLRGDRVTHRSPSSLMETDRETVPFVVSPWSFYLLHLLCPLPRP